MGGVPRGGSQVDIELPTTVPGPASPAIVATAEEASAAAQAGQSASSRSAEPSARLADGATMTRVSESLTEARNSAFVAAQVTEAAAIAKWVCAAPVEVVGGGQQSGQQQQVLQSMQSSSIRRGGYGRGACGARGIAHQVIYSRIYIDRSTNQPSCVCSLALDLPTDLATT